MLQRAAGGDGAVPAVSTAVGSRVVYAMADGRKSTTEMVFRQNSIFNIKAFLTQVETIESVPEPTSWRRQV